MPYAAARTVWGVTMANDYTAALQAAYEAELAEYEIRHLRGSRPPRAPAEPREPDLTTSRPGMASRKREAAKNKAELMARCINSGDWSVYYAAFPGQPVPVQFMERCRISGNFGHERGR